ncbi:MAG: PAS domain-containing protein [Novosphingobium sp.]
MANSIPDTLPGLETDTSPTRAQGTDALPLRFETLADALPQLIWSAPASGLSDYFNVHWVAFTGAPAAASYGTGWLDFVHPDCVAAVRADWAAALGTGEAYSTELLLRNADGTYRWMLTRGLPVKDDGGAIVRWIGTCTDIDERVRDGDLLEIVSRELSHRVKNVISVVQILVGTALRDHPEHKPLSQSLQARIVALGRAQDLVRPRIAGGAVINHQTTLHELIRFLTQPYVQGGAAQIDISGSDTAVEERAVTPLALFLHEMALNSVRFGALSVPEGLLRIHVAVGETIAIEWTETGGPVLDGIPAAGFGLRMTGISIERYLGGSLTLDWRPSGLYALAHVPASSVITP